MGGVRTGRDALELIAAGASAVALGTVLFSDPAAPARIRAELAAELAALGLASLGKRRVAHEARCQRNTSIWVESSTKMPANRAKSTRLTARGKLLDSRAMVPTKTQARRRFVLSISAWKPSSGRTTSGSGGRS